VRRIENPNHARFLTFSCFRRLPLFSNDVIKDAFVDQLSRSRERHGFLLHAWVVMPEHVHLIVRCPGGSTVTDLLRTLKTGHAKRVLARWKSLDAKILPSILDSEGNPKFWQSGGGYDRNLVHGDELFEKVRYIHENPDRRGLVTTLAEWQWSSARWWAGERDGQLPCDPL